MSVTGVYAFESGSPPVVPRALAIGGRRRRCSPQPPWWTPRHTLVLFVFMALTGIIGLVWARMIANKNAMVQEQYRAIIAERSRLASELHDTLEQGLAGIQLQLGAVARTLDTLAASARRALAIASDMLRYSLAEARRSVMDLRHGALETRDLVGALTEVAERMTTGTSVSVRRAHGRRRAAARQLAGASPVAHRAGGADERDQAFRRDRRSTSSSASRSDTVRLAVSDNGAGFADPGLDRIGRALRPARHSRARRQDRRRAHAREQHADGGAVVAVTAPNAGRRGRCTQETRHG